MALQPGSSSATQQYTTISGVDSNLLSLDIYYSSDYQVISRPVVIYIHGGGWCFGDKSAIYSKATFFNNLGYVFVSVNYCLSDKTLALQPVQNPIGSWPESRVKYPNHINDCATAVTWIYNHISSYGGNQNQLVLIGHSAGAHLVSLLSTNQSYLTAAGLPSGKVVGCISLDSTANSGILQQITNTIADGDFPQATLQKFYLNAFGIYPDNTVTGTATNITTDFATTAAAQASYTTASPISNIGSSTPPFLLFHRGDPDRITRENQFSTALQTAGKTYTLVTYPGDTTYTHDEINQSVGAVSDPPIGKTLPSGVSNVTTQIQNWITNLVPAPPVSAQTSISFSQISNEFGTPPAHNLGAYRVSQTVSALTNMPLDAGIPQSGEIKFSDFYSKKLNVVVDYTSPTTVTKVTGRTDYDANNSKITVIGNFRTRPVSPAGTKVWIHTNGDIGSDQKSNTRSYASLLTGNWDATTDLRVDIGPSGRVFGAGGNGGNGGNANTKSLTNGSSGGNGTSALGVNTSVFATITNRGRLQCGGGGGGGGASAWALHVYYVFPDTSSSSRQSDAGGGGGGGGAGYPAGSKGSGGSASANNAGVRGSNLAVGGSDGTDGALLTAGTGGLGGTATQFASEAFGGAGGDGEDDGTAADPGGGAAANGTDGEETSSPGSAGQSGYSIAVTNSSTGVSITNTGTLIGDIVYNTAAT